MKILNVLHSVINNKCPRCHQEKIFLYSNPYNLKNAFNMHKKCNHCQLVYEKEPGFFYGAMYVSYGLSVGWFIIWFGLQSFFLHLDTMGFAIGVAASIVVMSPVSLRLSRLIWLNLFYSFDKKYGKKETLIHK